VATGRPLSKWKTVRGVVPAGATVDFDPLVFDDIAGVDYQISLFNKTENKFLSFTLDGKRENADICSSVSKLIGDSISRTVNLLKIGTEVKLRISNGESFPLTLKGIRNERKTI